MASPGAATLDASPSARRCSPSQGYRAVHTEHRHGANAFDLLSRAGPAMTMASLHIKPQAAEMIAAEPPDIEALPDHLLQDILRLALASLRAVNSVPPARDAVRAWTNSLCVSKRWAALIADEPIRLRIDTERWPAILAALAGTRLPLSALELHMGSSTHPGGKPEPCHFKADCMAAGDALADLLADTGFQRRSVRHLTQLSWHFGLPAASLPLNSYHPCPWSRLQYLSLLTVDSISVSLLRQLPASLRVLHLKGFSEHRHEAWGTSNACVANTLSHLSRLRVLHLTRLHVSPAQLPQALDRLQLAYCTYDADEAWPAGMSVRWEGPMHQKGVRSVLFVRDGADVPTLWQ